MASDAAASQRTAADALEIERQLLVGRGGAGCHWWIPDGRRCVSLAMWREYLHAYSRTARVLSVELAGCQRPAAYGDSLRRSGAIPGAQASVSRNLRPLTLPRA